MACTKHFNAGSRHQREKGFISTDELEIVKTSVNRGSIGHAIKKTEGAHAGVHLVRRKQLFRDRRGVALRHLRLHAMTGCPNSGQCQCRQEQG